MRYFNLILLMLSIASIVTKAEEKSVALVVSHPNGSQTRIELFTMHKITMTNDSVFVFSLGSKIVMDNSEILRFTFENVTSGIKSVVIGQNLEQRGEFIYITPADYSKTLHLFDIEGHALCPNVTLTDNGICISLSELPKGVYVLSYNGLNYKIIRP